MFRVNDIWEEGKRVVGACDDETFLSWCSDVVTMIANKGDFEGFKYNFDICTVGCACATTGTCVNTTNTTGCMSDCASPTASCCGRQCITLPREIETVIAVNFDGYPSLGVGQLYNFHLNGAGDVGLGSCARIWQDLGANFCTIRDLITPARVVVYLDSPVDNGKQFIIYGFDSNGRQLQRTVGGQTLKGYQVPTLYGYAIPDSGAPTIARITGIFKEVSAGAMRLSTIDDSGPTTGVTLGIYEPDETLPQYRRIQLKRKVSWARVAAMKKNPVFTSRYDHVPLQSRLGFLLGLQARKYYRDKDIANAHSFEADATRLEVEAQMKLTAGLYATPQIIVHDVMGLRNKGDFNIV
jgi:hypothetical protein